MKNLLSIALLFSSIVVFGQNYSSEFGLTGQVQQVEITVVKNSTHFNKKGRKTFTTLDTIDYSFFEFSKNTTLINQLDSNFNLIHYKPNQNLDIMKFNVKYDSICGCEIATKLMEDTSEFEIHFRKYDNNGLLVSDSSVNRKRYEIYHEGPIVHKYTYDKFGNITYHWFKSSFVFALTENIFFEYVYDTYGNWIERKQYVLPISNCPLNQSELETSDLSVLYITRRNISYHF